MKQDNIHIISFTGESLAEELGMSWSSLYKQMKRMGLPYGKNDNIRPEDAAEIIQEYRQEKPRRDPEIVQAAQELYQQLNISITVNQAEQPREPLKAPAGYNRPERYEPPVQGPKPPKPRPELPQGKPRAKPNTPKPQPAPAQSASLTTSEQVALVLLTLVCCVFIAADAYSCGRIGYATYEESELAAKLFAGVGACIGLVSVGSLIWIETEEKAPEVLLGMVFVVFQFLVHFTAMPSVNLGIGTICVGLSAGTIGAAITIKFILKAAKDRQG